MNTEQIIALAEAQAKRERTVSWVLREKGHEWVSKGTPSEFWLLWGQGKVFWVPADRHPPLWAQQLRGEWDNAWS